MSWDRWRGMCFAAPVKGSRAKHSQCPASAQLSCASHIIYKDLSFSGARALLQESHKARGSSSMTDM